MLTSMTACHEREEWKARQELYHLSQPITDGLDTFKHVVKHNAGQAEIVLDVVNYLYKEVEVCVFPAKTFAVALLYAKLSEIHFGVPMLEALGDETLLYGNMRDFEPYPDSRGIYDAVMRIVDLDSALLNLPSQALETVSYYYREFFVGKRLDEISANII